MGIDENLIVVDGKTIGVFNVYDITGLAKCLAPNEQLQEVLLTGTTTVLEVLQNSVDQRVITTFAIVHK